MVYYLNMLFEYSHSDKGHHYYLLNPDLLGKFNPNDLPDIGVWVDNQGKIAQLSVNEIPVGIIAESKLQVLTCSAEPEKMDRGMLERLYEEVKKYL